MLGLTYPVSFFSAAAERAADAPSAATLSDQIGEWNQVHWTTS